MASVLTAGKSSHYLRTTLRFSAIDWARVLHVHPSSVARWEREPNKDARIDGVAAVVLQALPTLMTRMTEEERMDQADLVHNLQMQRGGLSALVYLLQLITNDSPEPAPTSRGRERTFVSGYRVG